MIFNFACNEEYQTKEQYIEPEFKAIVANFEKEQNVTVDIDIKFTEVEEPAIALCWWREDTKQGLRIEVDPDFWFTFALEGQQEEVIYHELGHCILGKDHDSNKINNYIPKSIMYPYVFGYAFLKYRSYYVDELKNPNVLLTDYLN